MKSARVTRNRYPLGELLLKFHTPLMNEEILNRNNHLTLHTQWRLMTTSKRVQDRSKRKRLHDLEVIVEKHKIVSKILFLLEILKQEPEQVMPIRSLDQYRRQINLPKPRNLSVFLRKSPKLLELYKDDRGTLWCGMTRTAEGLMDEEEKIIEENSDKAAECVTRMLMMAVDKRLPLDKIAHFRRDLGLPIDFRKDWVLRYPQNFKVVRPFKPHDERDYLELVDWNPSLAITKLEKKVSRITEGSNNCEHIPGWLSLAFPMKFPPNYKKVSRYRAQIENFQKREYLSPYADARGLKAGSQEFDKRAVAVMHELLSFMIEKRLVTDHLTHFRREFVMPQKLMRLLLKHFGIFYVSERGKRFSVFLNEAYEGSELVEKHPLVIWREKVESLIGYRKKKRIETIEDLPDTENFNLFGSESENEEVWFAHEKDIIGTSDDGLSEDNSEMDIEEIYQEYEE